MVRANEVQTRWLPLVGLPAAATFVALLIAAFVPQNFGTVDTRRTPTELAAATSATASLGVPSAVEPAPSAPAPLIAAGPAPSFGRRGFSPPLGRDEPVQELELPPPGVSGAIRNEGKARAPVALPAVVMVAGTGTASAVRSGPPEVVGERE
ncbi:MAG: hypothetical protein ACOY0T_27940 [Myxococcota bacterium]